MKAAVRLILCRSVVAWLLLATPGLMPADSGTGARTGEELARQVDFVNRFAAVANVSYGTRREPMVVVDRSPEGRALVNTLQRWRRNDFPAGRIAARDLAVFGSGKLKGTGILATDYADPADGRDYLIWLPSLRKIRRVSEPDPRESWSGSNFTFGDIYTRRPEDERFEILGREVFGDCLGVIDAASLPASRHIKSPPEADCAAKGRQVYRVAATPVGRELGYDRRIVWIDSQTFADYRSDYYRGGRLVKTIDKSWRSMGLDDPRAQYWLYWYARTDVSGQESMAYAPRDVVQWNTDLDPNLWTESTLRRIKR